MGSHFGHSVKQIKEMNNLIDSSSGAVPVERRTLRSKRRKPCRENCRCKCGDEQSGTQEVPEPRMRRC